MTETKGAEPELCYNAGCKDEGRGHEPRNAKNAVLDPGKGE